MFTGKPADAALPAGPACLRQGGGTARGHRRARSGRRPGPIGPATGADCAGNRHRGSLALLLGAVAAAGAAGGWLVVLWLVVLWLVVLRGLPVGATARAVGALSGLPPYAGVAVAVTLLLAALQVLAGAWLARAVMSLSAGGRGGPPAPDGPRPGPDPQRGASGDPRT